MKPTCICGRRMEFKPDETRTFCRAPGCGVVQEKRPEGYWALGMSRIVFTPGKRKMNHYERYMRWRNAQGKKGRR